MRFLMFVTVDPDLAANADGDVNAWLEKTGERRLEGGPLCQLSDATTVWPKDGGGTFVSDGPFAETKEHVVGYDIIECADLDEAIEIVSGHPVATFGAIELRPVWV